MDSFKFHNGWHRKHTRNIPEFPAPSPLLLFSGSRRVRVQLILSLTLLLPQISLCFPAENSNLQQIGIRALVFGLRLMAPETRSQDARRMANSLEAVHQRINGIEVKLQAQSDDLAQLKTMMMELA